MKEDVLLPSSEWYWLDDWEIDMSSVRGSVPVALISPSLVAPPLRLMLLWTTFVPSRLVARATNSGGRMRRNFQHSTPVVA